MKKRIRKIAGAVFLALAIAFTQIPASFVQALSPEAEFKRDGNTLISYTGTASVVSVPAGIKTISTDAFAGNRYLEEVTVPASVTKIDDYAFYSCTSLLKVNMLGNESDMTLGKKWYPTNNGASLGDELVINWKNK